MLKDIWLPGYQPFSKELSWVQQTQLLQYPELGDLQLGYQQPREYGLQTSRVTVGVHTCIAYMHSIHA